MNNKQIARELLKVAKALIATEFPTKEALEAYLKEHPDADPKNHSVKQAPKSDGKDAPKKEVKKEDVDNAVKDVMKSKNVMETKEGKFAANKSAGNQKVTDRANAVSQKLNINDDVKTHIKNAGDFAAKATAAAKRGDNKEAKKNHDEAAKSHLAAAYAHAAIAKNMKPGVPERKEHVNASKKHQKAAEQQESASVTHESVMSGSDFLKNWEPKALEKYLK